MFAAETKRCNFETATFGSTSLLSQHGFVLSEINIREKRYMQWPKTNEEIYEILADMDELFASAISEIQPIRICCS